MAVITIENVPDEIVLKYWLKIKYTSDIKFPSRVRKNTWKINNDIIYWDEKELENMWKTSTFTSKSF